MGLRKETKYSVNKLGLVLQYRFLSRLEKIPLASNMLKFKTMQVEKTS